MGHVNTVCKALNKNNETGEIEPPVPIFQGQDGKYAQSRARFLCEKITRLLELQAARPPTVPDSLHQQLGHLRGSLLHCLEVAGGELVILWMLEQL